MSLLQFLILFTNFIVFINAKLDSYCVTDNDCGFSEECGKNDHRCTIVIGAVFVIVAILLVIIAPCAICGLCIFCIFRLVNAQQSKNRQGQIHTSNPEAIPVHFRSYPSPDA